LNNNRAKEQFYQANINVVWEESIRVTNEWFDADLANNSDGEEINLLPVFTNITLLVISSAGFGRRTSWTSASSAFESNYYHSMSFAKAIKTAIHSLFLKAYIPPCVFTLFQMIHIPWLTPALNNTTMAFESLRSHMLEVVSDARAARTSGAKAGTAYPTSQGTTRPKEIKSGLLANLVEANTGYEDDNVAGEKRRTLTDDELLSDTFASFLALSSRIKDFTFRFSYSQDMVRRDI